MNWTDASPTEDTWGHSRTMRRRGLGSVSSTRSLKTELVRLNYIQKGEQTTSRSTRIAENAGKPATFFAGKGYDH